VALNILSTLLPEAYRHMHRHLTASPLGTKLFLAPFNRDVPLDQTGARALLSTVAKCKRVRDCLAVSAALDLTQWGSVHLLTHGTATVVYVALVIQASVILMPDFAS
jgi:hypothetical protein